MDGMSCRKDSLFMSRHEQGIIGYQAMSRHLQTSNTQLYQDRLAWLEIGQIGCWSLFYS